MNDINSGIVNTVAKRTPLNLNRAKYPSVNDDLVNGEYSCSGFRLEGGHSPLKGDPALEFSGAVVVYQFFAPSGYSLTRGVGAGVGRGGVSWSADGTSRESGLDSSSTSYTASAVSRYCCYYCCYCLNVKLPAVAAVVTVASQDHLGRLRYCCYYGIYCYRFRSRYTSEHSLNSNILNFFDRSPKCSLIIWLLWIILKTIKYKRQHLIFGE